MSTAYEIPNNRFSGIAGEAIARYRFVQIGSDEKIMYADAGDTPIGVSSNDPALGEIVEIFDGLVPVEASEGIAAGDAITSAADGKAAKAGTSDLLVGIALTTAVSGGLVTVKTLGFKVPVAILKTAAITGTAKVGETLTAGVTYVRSVPASPTLAYKWQICATVDGTYTDISGATNATYEAVTGDATKFIRCIVTATGTAVGTITTAPTTAVAAAS